MQHPIVALKGQNLYDTFYGAAPAGRNFLLCHTPSQGDALGCVVLAFQADSVPSAISFPFFCIMAWLYHLESNVLRNKRQCFSTCKALHFDLQVKALQPTELYSYHRKALLHTPTKHSFLA
jgi:hypothetical protein